MIEALQAHATSDNQRNLDEMAIIEVYEDGNAAMHGYRHLHLQYPVREFYFVHTNRVNN